MNLISNLGIEVEENYNIEEVAADVTAYVQTALDEMDADATISSSHNRRTINMQIDNNEPGRAYYHGKVLALFNFTCKITSITATKRIYIGLLMLMTM